MFSLFNFSSIFQAVNRPHLPLCADAHVHRACSAVPKDSLDMRLCPKMHRELGEVSVCVVLEICERTDRHVYHNSPMETG